MGMDAFDEIQAEDYYTQEDEVKIKFGKTRIMAHLGSSYITEEGHVSMNIIVTPEVYEKINRRFKDSTEGTLRRFQDGEYHA